MTEVDVNMVKKAIRGTEHKDEEKHLTVDRSTETAHKSILP